jgi:cytochrome c oxidase assembly protein subunit 15
LHAFYVVRTIKKGPILIGAVLVAVAVTLQAALGIWALLMVVPLPLALMHQAMAMVTLTLAVIHASEVMPRDAWSTRLVLS